MQESEQLLDPRVRDAIPERLPVPAIGHQSLVTHFGQVLRQRRLGKTDGASQRTRAGLSPLHQTTQDDQAAFVGDRAKQPRNF